MAKHTISTASASRIAGSLLLLVSERKEPIGLRDVLDAMREEDINGPVSMLPELLRAFRDAEQYKLVVMIAIDLAREWAGDRSKLIELRSALGGIGVVFNSDLKPESLKED